MNPMGIELRRFPGDLNLSDVNAFLLERGVPHVFTEEQGEQVLWLGSDTHVTLVNDFLDKYLSGEVALHRVEQPEQTVDSARPPLIQALKLTPLTSCMLLLGILGYVIGDVIQSRAVFNALAFWPIGDTILSLQWWRAITPAFLHFGIFHLVFNALWLYVLGRQLERCLRPKHYILLFLCCAIGGNALQFYVSGSNQFGGLSGVVYGFFGAFVSAHWLFKKPEFAVQDGLLVFALVSMALGFMGALDWLTPSGIAHWAHLGGFIAGLVYLYVFFYFRGSKHV